MTFVVTFRFRGKGEVQKRMVMATKRTIVSHLVPEGPPQPAAHGASSNVMVRIRRISTSYPFPRAPVIYAPGELFSMRTGIRRARQGTHLRLRQGSQTGNENT